MSRFSTVGPGANSYAPKTDLSGGFKTIPKDSLQQTEKFSGFNLDRYARSEVQRYPPINAAAMSVPADIMFQWVEWEYMFWFCSQCSNEKRDKWNSNNPQIRQRVKTQVLLNYALVCNNWFSVITSSSANPFWQDAAITRFVHLRAHRNVPNWYQFLKERIQIVQIDFMTPIENCDILLGNPNGGCPKIYEKLNISLSKEPSSGPCDVCKKTVYRVPNGAKFRTVLGRGDIVCIKTRKSLENAMTRHAAGDKGVEFINKELYDEQGPQRPTRRRWYV